MPRPDAGGGGGILLVRLQGRARCRGGIRAGVAVAIQFGVGCHFVLPDIRLGLGHAQIQRGIVGHTDQIVLGAVAVGRTVEGGQPYQIHAAHKVAGRAGIAGGGVGAGLVIYLHRCGRFQAVLLDQLDRLCGFFVPHALPDRTGDVPVVRGGLRGRFRRGFRGRRGRRGVGFGFLLLFFVSCQGFGHHVFQVQLGKVRLGDQGAVRCVAAYAVQFRIELPHPAAGQVRHDAFLHIGGVILGKGDRQRGPPRGIHFRRLHGGSQPCCQGQHRCHLQQKHPFSSFHRILLSLLFVCRISCGSSFCGGWRSLQKQRRPMP